MSGIAGAGGAGGATGAAVEARPSGLKRTLYLTEEIICILSLVVLALLPLAEAVARIFFQTGIPASSGYLNHFLLIAALVAGMICTRGGNHLSIALVQFIKDEKIKRALAVLSNLISASVATVLVWSSISFIIIGLDESRIGLVPVRAFALVIPVAFAVMAARFARRAVFTGWRRIIPPLVIVFATVLSFPVIAKIIWGFDPPDAAWDILDIFFDASFYLRLPVAVLLILAAFGGTPLFVVIGALSLFLLHAAGGELDSIPSDIYSALTTSSIIALPLFTIAGFFLSESKAGERLVATFRSLFSWMPGGIILASVVVSAFFTSFTGGSGITILALGGILYTILNGHLKYSEKFSAGFLTSAGSIGLLFPPSLPLILVGTTLQTNIFHMFVGGILPGLVLVAAIVTFGIVVSLKVKIPVEKFEPRRAFVAVKNSIFEIILPFFLIGFFATGVLSLVEIGALAVIYIFIVEVVIHREIKLGEIKGIFLKAIPIIGGVLSILAVSRAFSFFIVDTQAPANIANWMQGAITSPVVFLLLLNLFLIIVGSFMDIFSAILIVLPLLVPLAEVYGIHPVHLGIIFIINLEAGFLTPPVGINLFLAAYRFKKTFIEICRYVIPFLLIQLTVVFIVTYVPWLSTVLINLLQ
ncbi:MAG: TRAP transporter large permease subunit [Spirochaetes bacterium]|nr:TRAP transporter large permease subunit [Spirochaetota bacterium]